MRGGRGAGRRTPPRRPRAADPPPGPVAASDRRLLRRATAVVAVQTALAAALVVAAVVALVWAISLEERLSAAERKAEAALARAGDDGELAPGRAYVTDGLPASCSAATVEDLLADLPAGATRTEVCGTPVVAYVGEVDGVRSAAVRSTVEQQEETTRLAQLSILVGLVGVLLTAALGWVVARRAVRPLGDALASQRRFVADTSHELRTPVAIVMTRAQLLQRTTVDDGQRDELGQLVDDVRVLRDVVDDMLLSAELQHRPAAREPVDLGSLAQEVAASFAVAADEAGSRLDVVVAERAAERRTVAGSPSALRRAVAALVDNALHHVEEGGAVRIEVAREADRVAVRVVDDGDGLDPAQAAALGRRFARGGPGSGTGGGLRAVAASDRGGPRRLGLGLALVEEVVAAHGGRLHLDGRPGDGVTATLRLPPA